MFSFKFQTKPITITKPTTNIVSQSLEKVNEFVQKVEKDPTSSVVAKSNLMANIQATLTKTASPANKVCGLILLIHLVLSSIV